MEILNAEKPVPGHIYNYLEVDRYVFEVTCESINAFIEIEKMIVADDKKLGRDPFKNDIFWKVCNLAAKQCNAISQKIRRHCYDNELTDYGKTLRDECKPPTQRNN